MNKKCFAKLGVKADFNKNLLFEHQPKDKEYQKIGKK